MSKPAARFTFDEIELLAQGKERNQLELKNSTFLVLGHIGNSARKVTDKSAMRTTLAAMLGAEVGAFANSGGGTLVFGFNDKDGSLDSTAIPEFWETSKTLIEDWVSSILRAALEPPYEPFDCYSLVNSQGNRVVVIEVPVSDKAPHQAVADKMYYTRQGNSAEPANHWLIETIRNRRVHPLLIPEFLEPKSGVVSYSGQGGGNSSFVVLDLIFSITNGGNVLAEKWTCRFDCLFAKEIEIVPKADYRSLNLPKDTHPASRMVMAEHPLFPTQSIEISARVTVPASWMSAATAEPSLSVFTWPFLESNYPRGAWGKAERDANRWFNLNISIYADSAPKVSNQVMIDELMFWPKMESFLRNEQKRTVHLPPDFLTRRR